MTLIGFRPVLSKPVHPLPRTQALRFGQKPEQTGVIRTFEEAIARLKSPENGKDDAPQVVDYLTWAEPGHFAYRPYASSDGYHITGFGPYLRRSNPGQRSLKAGDYIIIGPDDNNAPRLGVLKIDHQLAHNFRNDPVIDGSGLFQGCLQHASLWKVTRMLELSGSLWDANVEPVAPYRPAHEIAQLINPRITWKRRIASFLSGIGWFH